MAREVELKAWVADRAGVEQQLHELCTFQRNFRKEDVYYQAAQPEADGVPQQLRLRRDGERAMVAFKDKVIRSGLEVSNEHEFSVGDTDAFNELLLRLGCTVYLRKTKTGSQFDCDGLSVELCDVEGLGTFVEIEYVSEEEDEQSVTDAELRIRALLERLGVDRERIEARPYAELLLGSGGRREPESGQ